MGVNICLWSEFEQKYKRYFFACELWVKTVGTFSVVLYRFYDRKFYFAF